MLFKIILVNLIQSSFSDSCPNIHLQMNPSINLTEYIRKTWYIQKQQINPYQPEEDLFCVATTYNIDKYSHTPFFRGKVISVYNYANYKKVNGISTNNSTVLCARQPNSLSPEKLLVAPCFLPNIFGGNYWILAAGPETYNYQWAIIIGGQPNVRITNTTCTTKEEGINGSGLWLFSRKRVLDTDSLNYLYKILNKNNISTTKLKNVSQAGCNYNNAFIK